MGKDSRQSVDYRQCVRRCPVCTLLFLSSLHASHPFIIFSFLSQSCSRPLAYSMLQDQHRQAAAGDRRRTPLAVLSPLPPHLLLSPRFLCPQPWPPHECARSSSTPVTVGSAAPLRPPHWPFVVALVGDAFLYFPQQGPCCNCIGPLLQNKNHLSFCRPYCNCRCLLAHWVVKGT